MTAITARPIAGEKSRFELRRPHPSAWLALGALAGGAAVALMVGFSLPLAAVTLAALPVLYVGDILLTRANNYLILHGDRVDLKVWEFGDFDPGLKVPYDRITAVRVHPDEDLLEFRYRYDDAEIAGAGVEMRSRDEALSVKDELLRRRDEARAATGQPG